MVVEFIGGEASVNLPAVMHLRVQTVDAPPFCVMAVQHIAAETPESRESKFFLTEPYRYTREGMDHYELQYLEA